MQTKMPSEDEADEAIKSLKEDPCSIKKALATTKIFLTSLPVGLMTCFVMSTYILIDFLMFNNRGALAF
jgi:hypothetical protein